MASWICAKCKVEVGGLSHLAVFGLNRTSIYNECWHCWRGPG